MGKKKLCWLQQKNDLKPVVLFALETAMRREEIATLTWEYINLANETVYLPEGKTKTGDARTVPLSSQAIAILQSMPRSIYKNQPVFGLTKDQITDMMRTTVKRA